MKAPEQILVSAADNGTRVDHFITAHFCGYGARKAKRLALNGFIRINGKIAASLQKVKTGDIVTLMEPEPARPESVKIIDAKNDCLFLHKPPNLHTVSLTGSNSPSLENWLRNEAICSHYSNYLLAQRLDYRTSGIVLAASDSRALQNFRLLEAGGGCEKFYLALLEGHLAAPITVKNELNPNRGPKSKILASDAPALRRTSITPLFYLENEIPAEILRQLQNDEEIFRKKMTIAGCVIKLGARHQIRAHAAASGFPLVGDGLYNAKSRIRDGFLLHQARLRFGHVSCVDMPQWLPEEWRKKIEIWFQKEE